MGLNNAIRATERKTGRKPAVIHFPNPKVKGSNYWISGSF